MQETWVQSLGWEDSPGEGKGYPLQYSGLENSKDCIVHGVAKSQTRLINFHFYNITHYHQYNIINILNYILLICDAVYYILLSFIYFYIVYIYY